MSEASENTTVQTTADHDAAGGASELDYDVVVVGAGFAGMYMLHRMRSAGYRAHVFETAEDVGGTWYWNRYPGARCDVESMEYSYSFDEDLQREWQWSERFATQPEILAYLRHAADKLDLRRDISFNTSVASAIYDESAATWTVNLDGREQVRARFVIMATGCLSQARLPDIPGLDGYRGLAIHTGDWPKEPVDFTGMRVGVLGTGSSGVQVIPLVAEQAAHTYVFQRTPNFTLPARNAELTDDQKVAFNDDHAALRDRARRSPNGTLRINYPEPASDAADELLQDRFEAAWEMGGSDIIATFSDLTRNQASNDKLAEFIRGKIRSIVKDPHLAELLTAQNYPVGAKRVCLGTDYYETFNREDVTLVDLLSEKLETITPKGIQTSAQEYELDAIVYATGFDAMTGAILRVDIRGRNGVSLREEWHAGPRTYLGLASEGFPNLFFITGPGSPSVMSNVVVSIEQHVDWITDLLAYMTEHHDATVEATMQAQTDWVEHVNDAASQTLMLKAASWYLGANVPGKPRVFMPYVGGVGRYREICDQVAADGYRGFTFDGASA